MNWTVPVTCELQQFSEGQITLISQANCSKLLIA